MPTPWRLAACSLLALCLACDKATPVAPVGSMLTITANPARIPPNGTSNITVTARREDGRPVNPGTEIIFSSTLGTIEPTVETDESGVARATLTGDGRIGVATVSALSGAATIVTVDVEVGSLPASITLQADPTFVNETGSEITLTSVVRDENGDLLANAAINFLTELGTLASGGAPVFTDASGTARDTLTVTSDDLVGFTGSTFAVRATAAGADGLLIEAVFDVAVQTLAPLASFTAVDAGICVVAFTNTTTGQEPISYEWDFDGDGTTDSTDANPTFDYGAANLITDTDGDGTCPDPDGFGDDAGIFNVTLDATNELGMDTAVQTVTVDPN